MGSFFTLIFILLHALSSFLSSLSRPLYKLSLNILSSPYCAVSVSQYLIECKLIRCYSLRSAYLIFEAFKILFPFLFDFYSYEVVFMKRLRKLRFRNGSYHETLKLLHASSCEMLRLVTYCMNQNKNRKQTLESAQYRLEIILKSTLYSALCITSFQKEMEI